jgi:hypothetical protein
VYCIAMPEGVSQVPVSIGQVKSAASDASLNSGVSDTYPIGSKFPLSLQYTIAGLLPLSSYVIYCYAETLTGTGNSLNQVIATKNDANTTCCKRLNFINKPAFIFGDVTKYTSSTIKSTYVFTYSLSAAPLSSLQVFPLINSSYVFVNPSSLNFTRASSLVGQFFLSSESSIEGIFSISLMAKGVDQRQFTFVDSISVTLMGSSTPLPPPMMTFSRFSDSGHNVVITFNGGTDQARFLGSFSCNTLFTFPGANQTTCSWVNSSAVILSFGNIVYLSVGDSVVLRGSLLKAFCSVTSTSCSSDTLAPRQSVITLRPRNPVRPVVIINAPSVLGLCADLSIDATGSYGSGSRAYSKVEWTVTAINYRQSSDVTIDVSDVQTSLNAFSAQYQVSRLFKIRSGRLREATYTFTLILTNFLGSTSFSTTVLDIISDLDILTLSVIGPSYLQITASRKLSILSAVTFSSCPSSTGKVKYTWSVINVNTGLNSALVSTSLDPRKFVLPAYSLSVGLSYLITVTATSGTSSTSAVPVTVFVSHGLVTAAVVGGYVRSAPINLDFVLDASISRDSDISPTVVTDSTLSYSVLIVN